MQNRDKCITNKIKNMRIRNQAHLARRSSTQVIHTKRRNNFLEFPNITITALLVPEKMVFMKLRENQNCPKNIEK